MLGADQLREEAKGGWRELHLVEEVEELAAELVGVVGVGGRAGVLVEVDQLGRSSFFDLVLGFKGIETGLILRSFNCVREF